MSGGNAIIVKRVNSGERCDVSEISSLAESAGYNIVDCYTQKRREDDDYNIGSGALSNLHVMSKEQEVDVVVFDNSLDPYQMYNVSIYLEGCVVFDRYLMILERFKERATSRLGQMQIELAQLKYQLPMVQIREKLSYKKDNHGFMSLGEQDKRAEQHVKSRISKLKGEIEECEKENKKRIKERKENGASVISLIGYTNAGKSELLRRLSSNNSVDENENIHPDLDKSIESEEKMFTTLDTRCRRMDFNKRDVLMVDTVGFVSDLSDDIVESFSATFANVTESDLDILLVDASEDKETIREKILATHEILKDKDTNIITVFNKSDISDNAQEKMDYVSDLCHTPLLVSAREGYNIDNLKSRIHRELPDMEKHEVELPMSDESMSKVSWIYDNAYVEDVKYYLNSIIVKFKATPKIVDIFESNVH